MKVEDSFEYSICDNNPIPACDNAMAVITVVKNTVTNITLANDDAYIIQPGAELLGNVLLNDIDPEGHSQIVNTTPIQGPSNGVLDLRADGSFNYKPNAGFEGRDSFVYRIDDNGSPIANSQATVILISNGIPDYLS